MFHPKSLAMIGLASLSTCFTSQGQTTKPLTMSDMLVQGYTQNEDKPPTVQWRPADNTHLDLVAMAGLNDSSPNAECWLIFGFDFGSGTHQQHGYKPAAFGN